MFPTLIRLVPFLAVLPLCLDVPTACGQQTPADRVRTLNDSLAYRVANAREIALERQDIKAVRALLRVAGAFRNLPASANGTQLTRELLKVEEHFGMNESIAPGGSPRSCRIRPASVARRPQLRRRRGSCRSAADAGHLLAHGSDEGPRADLDSRRWFDRR